MSSRPRLTVGSLRGVPQRAASARNGQPSGVVHTAPRWMPLALPSRRCCGTGCAGCPTGERIRAARRAGLPIA